MPDTIDQSGMTFGQHLVALAEAVGLAETTDDAGNAIEPRLPSDIATAKMLKDKWNAGYKEFLSGMRPIPAPGVLPYTRWSFLRRTLSVTMYPSGDGPDNIEGANWRYRLPDPIRGVPQHAWTLDIDGHTYPRRVQNVSAMLVLGRLSWQSNGYPDIACCRPIPNPDGSAAGGAWELIVAPKPTATAVLTADFELQPRDLVQTDDKHICGAQHDQTILAFAVLAWRRRDRDANAIQLDRADAQAKLEASIELDKSMRARSVGMVHDPGIDRVRMTRDLGRRLGGTNTTYITSGA